MSLYHSAPVHPKSNLGVAETVSHKPVHKVSMKSREGVGEILRTPYLPHTFRYQPSSSGKILPSSSAVPHHIGRVVRKASR
jgi:hypothetical protein